MQVTCFYVCVCLRECACVKTFIKNFLVLYFLLYMNVYFFFNIRYNMLAQKQLVTRSQKYRVKLKNKTKNNQNNNNYYIRNSLSFFIANKKHQVPILIANNC